MNQDQKGEKTAENSGQFGKLRLYNFGMGVLHLIQGIAMFVLSNDFSLPITTLYLKFDPEAVSLTQNLQVLGKIRLVPWSLYFC